ncbi:MAG: TolC family protein [Rhodanobacter sp.]
MSCFRSVPIGAVCLLYAALLSAAPVSPSSLAPNTASAALRMAVSEVWLASPELAAGSAERDAAHARALAAAQPLYNPSLLLESERADVDRHTVGIGLTLDLSGKRRARAGEGEAAEQVAQWNHQLLRRDVAARWLKAWSMSIIVDRQLALGQRRLTLMQRFDELAAQRLKVGDISSPERDLAGLALSEAQWQQAAIAGDEAAARGALASVGGESGASLPELPGELPPGADDLVPMPIDELPELRRAGALQAGTEAAVRVARRARIPDPQLSVTGGEVRSGPRTDRVVGISLSIPLPVRNSGGAEVQAARAQADAAAATLHSSRFVLAARLQETRQRYAALRAAAVAFRGSRASALDDRTSLLEKLWRAGEMGTSDYLVQLKQSLDTALAGQELESRVWQAWFDYLIAAGRLNDWLDGSTQDISR